MIKHILFVIILVGGGYYFWSSRPVVHGPGEVAPNPPHQQRSYGIQPIEYESYILKPIARFNIEARVLSKKRYYKDREANFAPYDFVVGWGPMSDERNLNDILIKQSERSYYWEMIEPPIPERQMRLNSTNIRLIPSTDDILKQLEDIRRGEIITVKGYLVNIDAPKDGWNMKSSLIRGDVGREAAELVWVKELSIL